MASRVQLINGQFQDNEGAVLAQGYLTTQLSQDAQITGGGGQVTGGSIDKVFLDSNGNAVGTGSPLL